MTDDEAFIRAIVDAPGDDAPRLIYADWLDERGDPRGEYLRVTVDWASRSCSPEQGEKFERRLRSVSRLLDPIWVSRITPPPHGVCCVHSRIDDRGTPVSALRLNELERRLRIKLPPEYCAFLMTYNGGIPHPDVYEVSYEYFWRLQAFFALSFPDSLEQYAEKLNKSLGRIAFLPIAATESHNCVRGELDDLGTEGPTQLNYSSHADMCICFELDTGVIVRVRFDSRADAASYYGPLSVEPVAKTLGFLLSRLDNLHEEWEPYDWQ